MMSPNHTIWELGMALCERTPMLERIFHPNTGVLFLCIDSTMRGRLNLLQFSLGQSQAHQRPQILPEVLIGNTFTHPFRLADVPVQPYQGEIGALRLRSTTLEGGPLRYYRIVDIPRLRSPSSLRPSSPPIVLPPRPPNSPRLG